MSFNQVIHKAADFVDGQVCAGMGIEKRSLIDILFLSGQRSIDYQLMDADLAHIQRCQLMGQIANMARLNATGIGKAGNFYAAIVRQIGDQTVVHHIAAEREVLSGFQCFDDAGCVFIAAFVGQFRVFNKGFCNISPLFDLNAASSGIFVQRNVVLLDEFGVLVLDEEGVVLGVVLAGLCAVVAEVLDVVQTNLVVEFGICDLGVDAGFDLGIQVNTFENIYFCKENTQMEIFRRITGLPNLTADYKKIDEPIAKILFGDSDPEVITHLAKILTEHPKAYMYDFIRSEPNLFEILPKGSGKGNLIPKLAGIVGISMDNTIAVGDYYNDISMLKAARIGVAVANACDEAKEAADFVTVSNDEHAIAKIIRDIDSGRICFDK